MSYVLKDFANRFTASTPTTVLGRLRTPTVIVSTTKEFTVYGRSFYDISNVYLSGAPYPQSTTYAPFSSVPRLSALFPPFQAIKLNSTSYYSNNDYWLTFTLPPPSKGGFVDVILENRAGYGALTKYVIKSTFNPYPSGTPEYNAYVPYVRPWASGIQVLTGATITVPETFYIVSIATSAIRIKTINNSNMVRILSGIGSETSVLGLDNSVLYTIDGSELVQI